MANGSNTHTISPNVGEWVVFTDITTGRLQLGEVTNITNAEIPNRSVFTIESILSSKCIFQTSTDEPISKPPDFAVHEIEYMKK